MSRDPAAALGAEPARIPAARARPDGSGGSDGAARPERIAGFLVVDQLGRGADSTVYRVRVDPQDVSPEAVERRSGDSGPDYALKILDWSPGDPEAALAGFRREAALLASVEHPRLSVVHEVGVADGRPYLVMDLVEGLSLADVLLPGPLTAEQVVDLGLDLVDPLAALHQRGLVHRDIKPENIMILTDGSARLIDFGLTGYPHRNGPDDGSDSGNDSENDVRAPVAVGTLAYAAPEQSGMLHRPVDARSDLYALGVVLFECLAGRLPFDASDPGELLRGHAQRPAPELATVVPGAPRGLSDLVALLLAKDPDDRYQSSPDLASDLHRLKTDPTIALRAVRRPLVTAYPHPVTGRADELAHLRAAWDAAQGGRGSVAVLRGPGGAGKSRLAAELARGAEAAGSVVLQGKSCGDDTLPFAPLRVALEQYLAAADRLPSPTREARHEMVRAACADHAALLLRDLTPGLAAILPTSDARSGTVADPFEPDQQDQFVSAVAGLLLGLARESGDLMLVVDDVQWIDPGSLRVLAELAGAVREAPVLVVATARSTDEEPGKAPGERPGEEAGEEAGRPSSEYGDEPGPAATDATGFDQALAGAIDLDLTLTPLTDDAVAAQLAALLPSLSRVPGLTELLVSRCEGNPFVVEEYLRAIVDAGLLRPSWGTWRLDEGGLEGLHLPRNVLGLVLARVAGLSPEARSLLVTASAIGNRFDAAVLAGIHGVSEETAVTALGEAAGKRLLGMRLGGGFRFTHDRIREALLTGLTPNDRARLHVRIAEALQGLPEQAYAVARHYIEGLTQAEEESADRVPADLSARTGLAERAFTACRAAGVRALGSHAPAEAVWFLEQALRFQPAPDGGFLHLLGQAHRQAGQLTEARHRLEQALATETDPLARAEALGLLAEVHRAGWDTDATFAAVEQGLAEAGARLPAGSLRRSLGALARFVLAQVVTVTRVGFGSAKGERRRRAEAIVALHEAGAYAGSLSLRPDRLVTHTVRALYWSTRIGPGRRYAHSQAAYGLLCAALGLRGASGRAFARAAHDPSDHLPTVRARTVMYREISAYFCGADDGQGLAAAVVSHSPWWDVGTFVDVCGLLAAEACTQGRTQQAADLIGLIERRLAGRRDLLSFPPNRVMLRAIQGRTAEAGAELQRIGRSHHGLDATGLTLLRLMATLFTLYEEGEHGAPFDAAVAELEALNVRQAQLARSYRVVHFLIALGRLEQVRAAGPEQRPARLAAARKAVQRVAAAPRLDLLRAQALLTRADLEVLEGTAGRALETLSRLPACFTVDAPTISWHAARIRARALAAAGARAESGRQARLASSIATSEGWTHRVRMIAAEFGTTAVEGAETARPAGPDRERLEALQQVSSAAARIFDSGELTRIALDEIVRVLSADRAFLFLLDESTGELVEHQGRNARGDDLTRITGYSASLVRRVRDTGEPLIVTGTDEAAALGSRSAVLHDLRSILVAPLLLEGRLLGVVYLDSQVARGIFTAADLGILTALTNHIATSLETARATQLEVTVQSAQQQRDLADTLRSTLQELSATLDSDEVTRRLLAAAPRIVHCDEAWLISQEEGDADNYTLVSADGEGGENGALVQHPGLADPALREFFMRAEPWVGTDADVPSGLTERLAEATSWVVLPLGEHAGRDLVMVMVSTAADTHLGDELSIASVLAAQGVSAYDKAGLFRRVQELAVTDELTGIANRRSFFEMAERDLAGARRHGRSLTAVMVDIDHFKRINDVHGHPTGDDVISEVARRLGLQIRTSDLLGRYGGEEFALLLQDAASDQEVEILPERLRSCIADPALPTRSGPVEATISIGVARLLDSDADLGALLARADEALYRAKADGRNCVRLAD